MQKWVDLISIGIFRSGPTSKAMCGSHNETLAVKEIFVSPLHGPTSPSQSTAVKIWCPDGQSFSPRLLWSRPRDDTNCWWLGWCSAKPMPEAPRTKQNELSKMVCKERNCKDKFKGEALKRETCNLQSSYNLQEHFILHLSINMLMAQLFKKQTHHRSLGPLRPPTSGTCLMVLCNTKHLFGQLFVIRAHFLSLAKIQKLFCQWSKSVIDVRPLDYILHK